MIRWEKKWEWVKNQNFDPFLFGNVFVLSREFCLVSVIVFCFISLNVYWIFSFSFFFLIKIYGKRATEIYSSIRWGFFLPRSHLFRSWSFRFLIIFVKKFIRNPSYILFSKKQSRFEWIPFKRPFFNKFCLCKREERA